MKFESLLNTKEYLHLAFLSCAFPGMVLFFDLSSSTERAQSLLLAGLIGFTYIFQTNHLKMQYWNFSDEKKDTNYELVGPFGAVFFICWLALIDYKTPEIVSKYTGLLMFATIFNVFHVNSEINKRTEARLVSDNMVIAFKWPVWVLFALLYLIATRYFLVQGVWEWDIPNALDLFKSAFGDIDGT